MSPNIRISPGPHISEPLSTQRVMLDVVIALVPAMIAAGVYFRMRAVVLIATCVLSAMATEWVCSLVRKKPSTLWDLSAVLTGIILALSVPAALPWWAAVVGSVFAIAIGKMVFGGLGANIFNPAMVGRAFLVASFGMLMTTWTVPASVTDPNALWVVPVAAGDTDASTRATEAYAASGQGADPQEYAVPAGTQMTAAQPTAITQATPLAWSKQAIRTRGMEEHKVVGADVANEQIVQMVTGRIGGCLGETSAIALLLGGAYLLIRRTITWHIPLAVLGTAFLIGAATWLINPGAFVAPWVHLAGGGMLIGAFFIATDPVTSPLSKKGELIFGIGVGGLIMLIRLVGEYPEGVMYAVLLMNAATPLIDRFTKLIPAGGKPRV